MEEKQITLQIDGHFITVPEGSTILEAACKIGINIPTLCHIDLKGTCIKNNPASCRICVVEVAGRRNLAPACATRCTEGMVVKTSTLRVMNARKVVAELILSDHPNDCLTCPKCGNCELQTLALRFNIREMPFNGGELSPRKREVTSSIVRNMDKCIFCRRCESVCNDVQTVGALGAIRRGFNTTIAPAFDRMMKDSECTYCGQCVAVCPVGALTERDYTNRLLDDLADPDKIVIVQTAPAVRAALGEEFGLPPGTLVTGKMVYALRELGFDYVTTSGTLGDPVTFVLTSEDLDRLSYNEYLSFTTTGCSKKDILQLMTTIDRRFMAGLAYYMGARELGMGVIRVGNGIPELQWDTIRRIHPTCGMVVPSFLIKLIEFAEKNHIDHNACSMQKCICIGEALRNQEFQLNTLGQKIHDKWSALQLYSTYASTEMQSSFTECSEFHGGHLQPELIIVEFLDDNNRPVAEGEAGEVTITTLGVEGMPLLRFKTGDICYHHTEPCACGRNTIRLSSILGRKGQMIKYKGTTLYPPALFDILDNIPSVKNYIIEVYTNELGTDEILIRIGSENRSEGFAKEIKDLFRSKVRVAPSINFESAEYIAKIQMPPMSRKTIKFIDLR